MLTWFEFLAGSFPFFCLINLGKLRFKKNLMATAPYSGFACQGVLFDIHGRLGSTRQGLWGVDIFIGMA